MNPREKFGHISNLIPRASCSGWYKERPPHWEIMTLHEKIINIIQKH